MGFIYKIHNNINNKDYIGQTTKSINDRWIEHKSHAKIGTDYYLYRAMRKYGIENFVIEQLEVCDNSLLNEREKYYIQKYDTLAPLGYNLTRGGDGHQVYDYNEIVKCYYKNDENITKTAEDIHCSYETIKAALNSQGIEPKLKGKQKIPIYECDEQNNILFEYEDYDDVIEKYSDLNMTRKAIGIAIAHNKKYRDKWFCRKKDYEKFKKINHKNKTKTEVYCIEKDISFESLSAAARWLKQNNPEIKGTICTVVGNISKAIKNNWMSYGFNWDFI